MRACARARMCAHTYMHIHAYIHASGLACTYISTCVRTHANENAHTHNITRTRTRTRTHIECMRAPVYVCMLVHFDAYMYGSQVLDFGQGILAVAGVFCPTATAGHRRPVSPTQRTMGRLTVVDPWPCCFESLSASASNPPCRQHS